MLKDVTNQKVKFADYGTIWKTASCITNLESNLQKDLESISSWTKKKWRMKLNAGKTEYCLFCQENVDDISLTLKDKHIKRVKETKLLGVVLDEKLTFGPHIQKTVTKLLKH